MDETTRYITTELELYSPHDLTALVAALEARGLIPCHVCQSSVDWHALFSCNSTADQPYDEPEPQIAAMLSAIETLDPPLRAAWAACSVRLFDIGYNCGREPFALRQELSAETLARLAAVGAALRITLYAYQRQSAERHSVCDQEVSEAEPGATADSGA
jgi:hypothetical protein